MGIKHKFLSLAIIFLLFSNNISANAGGPLVVKNGTPLVYKSSLVYRFDKGPLGTLSNSEARALIEDLLDDWETVSTSTITFERDNPDSLDNDISDDNFESILNSQDLLGYTPIIFDDDGALLDSFLGIGAGNSVLGLAGPITLSSGPLSNEIVESQAIFNGRFIDGIDNSGNPESDLNTFKGTVIHEFGHAFGLDHSQINVEAVQPGATTSIRQTVPLMFPVAVNSLFEIKADDIAAASLLYPNSSNLAAFGQIEGKVFRSDGSTPVRGANVIARKIDDPTNKAVSCVSDYLSENDGSFVLFGLEPGDYRLEVEPIDLSFTGGSGVGPFSNNKTDLSFQNPVPEGFFTGTNQAITENENDGLIISVNAGQTITDQNIIASLTQSSSTSSSSTSSSSSSSSTGGTTTISEEEPNDTIDGAQTVSFPSTISGTASITDSGEIELGSDSGAMVVISDLFKFTLPADATINALLDISSTSSDNDLDLVLLDDFATEIIDSSSQTGNSNELITGSLQAGTYLLGVGAFSGSSDYELSLTAESESGSPFISITGTDTLVLNPSGKKNMVKLDVSAFNFPSKSVCTVTDTGSISVKVKPRKFKFTPNKVSKRIKVTVRKRDALDLINSDATANVNIRVDCNNGSFANFDLEILPNIDSISSRAYKQLRRRE